MADAAKDAYAIEKLFRKMRVPSCEDGPAFGNLAKSELGVPLVREWDRMRSDHELGHSDAFYELVFSSTRSALVLMGGAQSDMARKELEWLVPSIRALGPDPLVVEIGAGCGLAAATLAAMGGARVIAIDAQPRAADITRDVARLAGVEVEAHTGTQADLPAILGGREPAALYGFRVLRYIQDHVHMGYGYSDAGRFEAARAAAEVSPAMADLFAALPQSAPIFASDKSCIDRIGEMAGIAETSGRSMAAADVRVLRATVLSDPDDTVAYALRAGAEPVSGAAVVAALGGSLPKLKEGMLLEQETAEAMRKAVQPDRTIWLRQIRSAQGGEQRVEVMLAGGLLVHYNSENTGARQFFVEGRASDDQALQDRFAAWDGELESKGATVTPITVPGDAW